jgi:hypothetical protein
MMNEHIEHTNKKAPTTQSLSPSSAQALLCILIFMLSTSPAYGQVVATQDTPPSGPQGAASPEQPGNFLRRLFHAYQQDWAGAAPNAPEPPRFATEFAAVPERRLDLRRIVSHRRHKYY